MSADLGNNGIELGFELDLETLEKVISQPDKWEEGFLLQHDEEKE